MTGRLAWLAALCCALFALPARAQPQPDAADEAQEPPRDHGQEPLEVAATDSPRAALERFLEFTRADMYTEAARFLDLGAIEPARGPELAPCYDPFYNDF